MHSAQIPIVLSDDVQVSPDGQPLPSSPRQPSMQALVSSWQILPLSTAPQSLSVMHSAQIPIVLSDDVQVSPDGQPLPSSPRQPSMQALVSSWQILPLSNAPQSLSLKHCAHVPMLLSVEEHVRPDAQPLPFSPRQPSTQAWSVSWQILPLSAAPHWLSVMHPTQDPTVESLEEHTSGSGHPSPTLPVQPATHVFVELQSCPLFGPPQSL
jgi:hypothetical protein